MQDPLAARPTRVRGHVGLLCPGRPRRRGVGDGRPVAGPFGAACCAPLHNEFGPGGDTRSCPVPVRCRYRAARPGQHRQQQFHAIRQTHKEAAANSRWTLAPHQPTHPGASEHSLDAPGVYCRQLGLCCASALDGGRKFLWDAERTMNGWLTHGRGQDGWPITGRKRIVRAATAL